MISKPSKKLPRPSLNIFLSFFAVQHFFLLQIREASALPTAIDFMRKFGYLEAGNPSVAETLYTEDVIREALKDVQKFGGLKETGILDKRTRALFDKPRCGNPDMNGKSKKRFKRFTIGSDGWTKRDLTFDLQNWTWKIEGGKMEIEKALMKAFSVWSKVSGLKFKSIDGNSNSADINIFFAGGSHGDGYAFDGPGRTLAHAYYPRYNGPLSGDIHFDEAEQWTSSKNSEDGTQFFSVAVHEIGHALGLSHSPDPESIMFPYYKGGEDERNFRLGYDDILGMYHLYGGVYPLDPTTTAIPSTTSTTTTASTTSRKPSIDYDDDVLVNDQPKDEAGKKTDNVEPQAPDLNLLCDGKFDTFTTIRGELYVFKDKWMWRFRGRKDPYPEYPVQFSRMFPFTDEDEVERIDAVYERPSDGAIVFFSGKQYWIYDGYTFIENSPKYLTSLGLPVNLTKVDAAFTWAKNDHTYIFAGKNYWKIEKYSGQTESEFPKTNWLKNDEEKFSPVTSVFTWKNGVTYFFNGDKFWSLNDEKSRLKLTTEFTPLV